MARSQSRTEEEEVLLTGDVSQMRDALRDEIDASKRAASSSDVHLVNGRLAGQIGGGFVYAFSLKSPLERPDGASGDLIVDGRDPIDASIVSVDGFSVKVSVGLNLGDFVPAARLRTDLTYLLRKLISRLEERDAGQDNRLGDAILGRVKTERGTADEKTPELNDQQREAVNAALGQPVTFIWGPPGTGKTRTIGAIGELLGRRQQSLLLVSHTNAAVDQALLNIADALGEELVDGSVIRLGEASDVRLAERPRLLAETHVRERSQALNEEADELRAQKSSLVDIAEQLNATIGLAEWVKRADGDLRQWRSQAEELTRLLGEMRARQEELDEATANSDVLAEHRPAAAAAREAEEKLRVLSEQIADLERKMDAATRDIDEATVTQQEAERVLTEVQQSNGLMRRWRGMPNEDVQAGVVHRLTLERDGFVRSRDKLSKRRDEASKLAEELSAELSSFVEEHAARPTAFLNQLAELENQVASLTKTVSSKAREVNDQRSDLTSHLRRGWQAVSESSLESISGEESIPHDPLEAIERLEAALGEARELTKDFDEASARRELEKTNAEIRLIDERLTGIEEALAQVEHDVVSEATVVATTLTRAYLRDSVQERTFDTVILDEASVAPIPALWLVAERAERAVVVVGDFKQLPPIKHSTSEIAERWLGRDIFSAAGLDSAPPDPSAPPMVSLREQHRMDPKISAIVNDLIYAGQLADAPGLSERDEPGAWFDSSLIGDKEVLLVDTGPSNAWVTTTGSASSPSRLNIYSATVCVDLARQMLADPREELAEGERRRILIVSPYRPHARLVQLLLEEDGLEREVVSGTAHTFQGNEADVVIFDLVNDEPHWRVRLFDPGADEDSRRLLNVAITRARSRLVVVGDFDYISRTGKNSFLGSLVNYLRENYPSVSAEEAVTAGIRQRAGEASATLHGGDVEPKHKRAVFTDDEFYPAVISDFARAKSRIVVFSPFITANRIAQLEAPLRAAVERGVEVVVITKALEDRTARKDRGSYEQLEQTLEDWGAKVLHKLRMHEKMILIDENIIWTGSLNPLSYSNTQEVMERRSSSEVFNEYWEKLKVGDLVAERSVERPECPICGAELVAAEGVKEPVYWRCSRDKDCYMRSVGDPKPVDGRLVCRSCGSPLEFGYWGDRPVWRCTKPASKHRQNIARSHLKLPAMLELVPRSERAAVASRLKLEPSGLLARTPNEQLELLDPDERESLLTPRQADVLGAMRKFETASEIAAHLDVKKGTVKSYIKEINRKLGTNSREEALQVAASLGLIDGVGD